MRGLIAMAVVSTAAAVLLQPAAAARAACGGGLVCSTVTVPLDRSGHVPGTVTLHVEVLPATVSPSKGTIFLVAGGPGQGSAATFDLGRATSAEFFRALFPGYALVAFDNRGTGSSGRLDCPNDSLRDPASIVSGCADLLGSVRDFYATPDHVEDLEAVRQAVGADRIAILGVSYGTKLALAYAAAHPDHVERLLLDSVVPLDRPDPFSTDELTALPTTLAHYCPSTTCRAATPDFSGDVVALANALAAKPLAGLDAADFLELAVSADLSPGLAAELPAAVHAARAGRSRPLLRLEKIANDASVRENDVSLGLYLATTCHDGTFPWQPGASLADRTSSLQSASAGRLGPFGAWALPLGSAYTCLGWPTPAAGTSVGAQPLPDVPMLAISGGLDLRTPTAWATSVVSQFPRGHLVVVPGVGHSVLTTDPSGCSAAAVLRWMSGSTPTARCPRAQPYVATVPSYPAHLPARLGATRTLAVAGETLHDAEAIWLMAADPAGATATEPGLDGGTLSAGRSSFRLRNYAITPRVALSGVLRISGAAVPVAFSGTVTVSGQGAAHGTLTLRGGKLVGKLG